MAEVSKGPGTGSGWREASVLFTQIKPWTWTIAVPVERPRGDRGHQHTDTEERTLHNRIDKVC